MPHTITLTIEDVLWKQMQNHAEVPWPAVMKDAVREKLRALARLRQLAERSSLSEEDTRDFSVELGRRVNAAL